MSDPHNQRPQIAKRIHDLLLHELGEHIDMGLLLGPAEYARAVLSLCRGSGRAELAALGEEFQRLTRVEKDMERARSVAALPGGHRPPPQDDRAARFTEAHG